VRTLHELLGSNTTVAELCELRVEDVRDMLATARAQQLARADSVTAVDPTGDGSNGVAALPGEDAGTQSAGIQLPGRPDDQDSPGLR
jgi:hypothetical protein